MVIVDTALELASNIAGAVKEFFGYQSKKLDLKNSAPVEKAAELQNVVNQQADVAKAIAERNENEIRKHIAE